MGRKQLTHPVATTVKVVVSAIVVLFVIGVIGEVILRVTGVAR